MIEEDDEVTEEGGGGGAGWLATFADLMSLLMCFFVLLLSFSEMDAKKFQAASGSIKNAFGVQTVEFLVDRPSSFATFDEGFGKGDKELEQQLFSDTKVALQFNSFCERENHRNEKERIELESDVMKLQARLQKILSKNIKNQQVLIDREGLFLTLSLNEKKVFKNKSSRFLPGVSLPWNQVFKEIRPWVGTLSVQTFGNLDRKQKKEGVSDWKQSFDRALLVGHLLQEFGKIPSEKIQIGGVALTDKNPEDERRSLASNQFDRNIDIKIRVTYPEDEGP